MCKVDNVLVLRDPLLISMQSRPIKKKMKRVFLALEILLWRQRNNEKLLKLNDLCLVTLYKRNFASSPLYTYHEISWTIPLILDLF